MPITCGFSMSWVMSVDMGTTLSRTPCALWVLPADISIYNTLRHPFSPMMRWNREQSFEYFPEMLWSPDKRETKSPEEEGYQGRFGETWATRRVYTSLWKGMSPTETTVWCCITIGADISTIMLMLKIFVTLCVNTYAYVLLYHEIYIQL